MAFAAKIDYVGLASISGLTLKSNGQNGTNSVLEIPGADGSIIGEEIYGHVKNPTCGYAITGTASLSGIALGKVHGSSGTTPFALSRIRISTGAGTEPTIEADAVEIESDANQSVCTYAIDELSVTPARHALTFGAFTYTESLSCALQSSDFEASVNLDPTTINGEPVASDSTAGRETVSVTMWSNTETTAPTVTI